MCELHDEEDKKFAKMKMNELLKHYSYAQVDFRRKMFDARNSLHVSRKGG